MRGACKMSRPDIQTLPTLRDYVLAFACDEIMGTSGRAELARLDDLLAGAMVRHPDDWRRMAAARDAALQYAAALAMAGFAAGMGSGGGC